MKRLGRSEHSDSVALIREDLVGNSSSLRSHRVETLVDSVEAPSFQSW